jgi:hypothetical protein
VRVGYQAIRETLHVRSDASVEPLAERCRFSPVQDVVSLSVPVTIQIVKLGRAACAEAGYPGNRPLPQGSSHDFVADSESERPDAEVKTPLDRESRNGVIAYTNGPG